MRWCVRRWWREQGEGRGGEGRGTSVGGEVRWCVRRWWRVREEGERGGAHLWGGGEVVC